jgi:predicted outer membrane protein
MVFAFGGSPEVIMAKMHPWTLAAAIAALGGTLHADTSPRVSAELCTMNDGAKLRSALIALHQSNRDEIALGKLASDRAESSEVKEFATMMVRDHAAADKKLLDLAKLEKIDLELPGTLDPVRAALADASRTLQNTLSTLRGSTFDTAYVAPQLWMHDLTINVVEEGQKIANLPNVINYFKTAHQTISDHRERALALQNRLAFTATPIGGGPTAAPPSSASPSPAVDRHPTP